MKGKKINSRAKGKRVELAAAKFLTSLGLGQIVRSAQFKGNANAGDLCFADGSPLPVHIEVKSKDDMDIGTRRLDKAVEQAKEDANGKVWAVLWKRKNTRWRITGYFGQTIPENLFVMTADERDVERLLLRHWGETP